MAEAAPQPLQHIGPGQRIAHEGQSLFIEIRGIEQRPRFLGLGGGRQAEWDRLFRPARSEEVIRDLDCVGAGL